MGRLVVFATIVALSLVCVLADYFIKRAADSAHLIVNRHFAIGTALYALSAFGWVFVLRHAKLATIGAIYSVVLVVGLALLGVVVFRESITPTEYVGLGCAVAALMLLSRFG